MGVDGWTGGGGGLPPKLPSLIRFVRCQTQQMPFPARRPAPFVDVCLLSVLCCTVPSRLKSSLLYLYICFMPVIHSGERVHLYQFSRKTLRRLKRANISYTHVLIPLNRERHQTQRSGTKLPDVGFIQPLDHSFIVAVTACCLPSATAATPLCGLARGGRVRGGDTMVALTQVIQRVQPGACVVLFCFSGAGVGTDKRGNVSHMRSSSANKDKAAP